MRRAFIYTHRSVRHVHISRWTWVTTLLAPAGILLILLSKLNLLLNLHQNFVRWTLSLTVSDPVEWRLEPLLAPTVQAAIPNLAFARVQAQPWRLLAPTILLCAFAMALWAAYPLLRGFLLFVLFLLAAGEVNAYWAPESAHLTPATFTRVWLSTEIIIWCLSPWIFGCLLLAHPSWMISLFSQVLTSIWLYTLSAVRLAFSLAALHWWGIVFAPLLWFLLGLLFDCVLLMVAYSLTASHAARHLRGARR